jgi:hypothetical protein
MKFGYFTLSDNHYADNRGANQFVADIMTRRCTRNRWGCTRLDRRLDSTRRVVVPDLALAYIAARSG